MQKGYPEGVMQSAKLSFKNPEFGLIPVHKNARSTSISVF